MTSNAACTGGAGGAGAGLPGWSGSGGAGRGRARSLLQAAGMVALEGVAAAQQVRRVDAGSAPAAPAPAPAAAPAPAPAAPACHLAAPGDRAAK